MAKKIRWDKPPSHMIQKVQQRSRGLQPALEVLAATYAAKGQATMQERAGWTDRTAYARSSLFGRSEGLAIYLGTTNDEYGHFLELGTSRMPAFPTISPTLVEIQYEYFRDATALAGRILFGGV